MIGLDTGFFVRVLENNQEAIEVWKSLMEGNEQAVVCCLTLFELERLGLKGAIDQESVKVITDAILAVCGVVWLQDKELLSLAAKISHGNGIPAIDALIVASLITFHATVIYTTDSDLTAYKKKGIKIIMI